MFSCSWSRFEEKKGLNLTDFVDSIKVFTVSTIHKILWIYL